MADGLELQYQTDRFNPDTDGDGITDGDEVYLTRTSPTATDSDQEGVDDYTAFLAVLAEFPTVPLQTTQTVSQELAAWANAYDLDGDGMTNVYEWVYGLNPLSPHDGADDPDGDFLTNMEESQI